MNKLKEKIIKILKVDMWYEAEKIFKQFLGGTSLFITSGILYFLGQYFNNIYLSNILLYIF